MREAHPPQTTFYPCRSLLTEHLHFIVGLKTGEKPRNSVRIRPHSLWSDKKLAKGAHIKDSPMVATAGPSRLVLYR